MTMQPVESSNIKAVGYDPQSQILRVEFHGGNTYNYTGVSRQRHQAFMATASKGTYFHRHIRSGYEFEKHQTPKQAE